MNRDKLFLGDIIKACDRIAKYIATGKEDFLADEMAQDAVVRNLEIIGEAAKQLSETIRARALEQPWRQITDMRNLLAHRYFSVDIEIVWFTAADVLPPFRSRVAELDGLVDC